MKKLVYSLPAVSAKKDFFYNMLGSLFNAIVSALALMIVGRAMGSVQAGIYSLAYSTAQMMYTFAVFEARNVQVTDAKHEYNFNEILGYRVITIVASWLFIVIFCISKNYTGQKSVLIILLTLYMTALAFSDAFQGNVHLNGYLFIAGKSLAAQTSLAFALFVIFAVTTKNLVISAIPMVVIVVLWIVFYDLPYNRNFSNNKPRFNKTALKGLFFATLPLFASSFLQQYIFNAPKYAIDSVLSEVEQSQYGYLVMPTFFINLFSMFIFRPQLITLSQKWAQKQFNSFKKSILVLCGGILAVTVVVLIGGYLLGTQLLSLFYGTDLTAERTTLMILLLAGSFSALCSFIGTVLTIMRKQKYNIISFVLTFVASLCVPQLLVKAFALKGAAIAYLAEMALLFVLSFIIFAINFKREERRING